MKWQQTLTITNIFVMLTLYFLCQQERVVYVLFTRSTLLIACSLASAFAITACSNANNEDKKQTTLTASAPATGEASTLIERNAQQRLSTTLQQHFKTAGINAKITDIKATEVPNLFWGES